MLFSAVLLALVALTARITYINATSGSKYKKQVLSQAQQKYQSQTLPAKRGDIYDRNGNILATSNKVYNVILDCKTVNSDEDYVEPTINALTEVLGLDENKIRSLLSDDKTKESQYQILTKQLSMDKKKAFEEYESADVDSGLTTAQAEQRANIKGVWFEEDYLRSYPFNDAACDTIGFTLDRDVADVGLEGYYNSTLTGVDGRQYGYINNDSDVEQTIIPANNGKSIQTSIDIGAQQIVEKYVNGFKEAMGAKNIGVIVEDPSTGEIIAMDGGDRYDLNNPRDLSNVYSKEEIKAMNDEETVEALNGMWSNFSVTDAYEPGSVVKPIVMAAALEKGVIQESDTFVCDGSQTFGDTLIKCAVWPDAHGTRLRAHYSAPHPQHTLPLPGGGVTHARVPIPRHGGRLPPLQPGVHAAFQRRKNNSVDLPPDRDHLLGLLCAAGGACRRPSEGRGARCRAGALLRRDVAERKEAAASHLRPVGAPPEKGREAALLGDGHADLLAGRHPRGKRAVHRSLSL